MPPVTAPEQRLASSASLPKDILVEAADGVLKVTFNRLEKLNAIRQQTLEELRAAIDEAALDDSIRVVMITGAGRAFCAGQDLTDLESRLDEPSESDTNRYLDLLQGLTLQVIELPKVVIAAINGVAVGFGAEISLAADLRIASTDARIGFVEVTRGLSPTGGITWLLPRLIGHGSAADLLISGEIVDAATAEKIGLVSRIFQPDAFELASQELSERIAGNAPVSTAIVKGALQATWTRDLREMLEIEVQGMKTCLATEDLAEGTSSFRENRMPIYRGR